MHPPHVFPSSPDVKASASETANKSIDRFGIGPNSFGDLMRAFEISGAGLPIFRLKSWLQKKRRMDAPRLPEPHDAGTAAAAAHPL